MENGAKEKNKTRCVLCLRHCKHVFTFLTWIFLSAVLHAILWNTKYLYKNKRKAETHSAIHLLAIQKARSINRQLKRNNNERCACIESSCFFLFFLFLFVSFAILFSFRRWQNERKQKSSNEKMCECVHWPV